MLEIIPEIDIIVKLVLSILIGAMIGLEREVHERPAGLRTHALVCMGAVIFTIISVSLIGEGIDGVRIAAGIVTGIGFIGAGAIFRAENKVSGITTAATLWVVAAVGVAIGMGYFGMAIVSAVLVLATLTIGGMFEHRALKKD